MSAAHRGKSGTPAAAGAGAVVLVGTPIGNLGDLSDRAVEVLRTADAVYCEDTRRTRQLLAHAGVTGVRLHSLHEHNERQRISEVVQAAARGEQVALVSDAGMPGISDPGSRVVRAAVEAGLRVTVVPGPSALLAALVTSGLATDRFCFEGFLPRSGGVRSERLADLSDERRTTVLFEAPGRVAGTLRELATSWGADRQVAVSRELTKVHEEVWRGSLGAAADWAAEHPPRGEVVLVVAGATSARAEVTDEAIVEALARRLRSGERLRGVVDEISDAFEVPRRRVYELALDHAEGRSPRNAQMAPSPMEEE